MTIDIEPRRRADTRLEPSRMTPADLVRTSLVGLRTRLTRAVLSAVGIMIGIASMVAVLGLSESSKSELLAQLDRLGTNLLRVQAGTGIGRGAGVLPAEAAAMIGRIGPVEATSSVGDVDANVYRNDLVPDGQTGGITVKAIEPDLLETLAGSVSSGRFHDEASAQFPTVVLGAVSAERLGIKALSGQPVVWLGDQWFSVIGVLDLFELSPDLDRAALVGIGPPRSTSIMMAFQQPSTSVPTHSRSTWSAPSSRRRRTPKTPRKSRSTDHPMPSRLGRRPTTP